MTEMVVHGGGSGCARGGNGGAVGDRNGGARNGGAGIGGSNGDNGVGSDVVFLLTMVLILVL